MRFDDTVGRYAIKVEIDLEREILNLTLKSKTRRKNIIELTRERNTKFSPKNKRRRTYIGNRAQVAKYLP